MVKNRLNITISKDFFPINKNRIGDLKVYFNSHELPEVDIYDGMLFSIKSNIPNLRISDSIDISIKTSSSIC